VRVSPLGVANPHPSSDLISPRSHRLSQAVHCAAPSPSSPPASCTQHHLPELSTASTTSPGSSSALVDLAAVRGARRRQVVLLRVLLLPAAARGSPGSGVWISWRRRVAADPNGDAWRRCLVAATPNDGGWLSSLCSSCWRRRQNPSPTSRDLIAFSFCIQGPSCFLFLLA
jgi:hypothetical protein